MECTEREKERVREGKGEEVQKGLKASGERRRRTRRLSTATPFHVSHKPLPSRTGS